MRALAAARGHSYGYVHDALAESGTRLRGRGGPSNRARSGRSTPHLSDRNDGSS
ncbi:transcriptional regulator [Mycobacteroides abscessus]|nr:transcriptional regulator [Mycobacteroides abscessus]TKV37299.1 transcriptional regulator [Mycobacteroides abscessus subsp. bolletii]PVA94625.1 transcriptional regulator [Mycobacteroides abscessus]PVB08948.1 transcriptional regulator [Mycobacteroides abscessus]RIT47575.1 transcriptional regulator [Mycobacteroides abscessus]